MVGVFDPYFDGSRNTRNVLGAPTASNDPSGDNAAQDCVRGRGSEGTAAMAWPVSAS
jgi:hypothetical protein